MLELNAVTDGEEENELKSSLSYEVKSVKVSPESEGESDVELKINISAPLPPLRVSAPDPPTS